MSIAKQMLKSSYVVSHTGFLDGLSVVSCADVGIEAGETDGLGVGDGCGDVFGLAVGCLVYCMYAKKKDFE